MAKEEKIEITEGSRNIFADLDLENPEELLTKSRLVIAISRIIESQKMTQTNLAKLAGINQPQVSRLLRGQTEGYSSDRLFRILNQLGQDVEITIRPASDSRPGQVDVRMDQPVPAARALFVAEEKAKYGEKPKKPKKNPAK